MPLLEAYILSSLMHDAGTAEGIEEQIAVLARARGREIAQGIEAACFRAPEGLAALKLARRRADPLALAFHVKRIGKHG